MAGAIEDYGHCLEIWNSAGTDEIMLPPMSRADALSLRSRGNRGDQAGDGEQSEQPEVLTHGTLPRATMLFLRLLPLGVGRDRSASRTRPVPVQTAGGRRVLTRKVSRSDSLVPATDTADQPWLRLRKTPVRWHSDPFTPVVAERDINALKK